MSEICLIIPIIFPLLSIAVLSLMKIKNERILKLLYLSITLINSIIIFLLVFTGTEGSLKIYSFTETLSIEFRLDGLGSLFALLIATLWPFVTLYSFGYMQDDSRKNRFFKFFILTYGINTGVCFSGNLITLYVFFEMLTLITVPLVMHKSDENSMYAGRKYACFSLGGSAFAFTGIVFFTSIAGSADFVYGGILNNAETYNNTLMQISYLIMFFGLGIKAAIFPFFGWLPTASVAPTPVTALLHAVSVVKAGAFAIMRITYYSFGTDFLYGTVAANIGLFIALLTVVLGAVLAVRERHLKKRLAYSTVSNLSYIVLGTMLMTPEGFAAGMDHMVFHAFMKCGLFLCAGTFMHMTKKEYVYEMDGVGKTMPITFACFTVGALSMIGIPPLCGFISKWKLIAASFDVGTVMAFIASAALITSAVLCAVYLLSIVVRVYFPGRGKDDFPEKVSNEAPATMLIPILFFTVMVIVMGLFSSPITDAVYKIATGGM